MVSPDVPMATSSNMFVRGHLREDYALPGITLSSGTQLTIVSIGTEGPDLIAQCRVCRDGKWTLAGIPLSLLTTDPPSSP
jgi:hypothetical protein